MTKRFRFRLSRVLPPFMRSRFKGDEGSAAAAAAAFDHVDFQPPDRVDMLRQPPIVSATGCCRPSRRRSRRWSPPSSAVVEGDFPRPRAATAEYLWRKEEKYWHVVNCGGGDVDVDVNEELLPSSPRRKIDSDDGGAIFPPLDTRKRGAEHRRRRRKEAAARKMSLSRFRPSRSNSSPDDADEDSGWFSTDEENDKMLMDEYFNGYFHCGGDDDTETLISTTDVDSSADNAVLRRKLSIGARGGNGARRSMMSWPTPERGAAVVKRLVPCTTTAVAVRDSFAVVKRSEDPRADFRQSMAEMVIEKEIFDPRGLEQLLRCFLTLNSRSHHAAIVAAFEDIWDALFPAPAGRGHWHF